MKRILLFPKLGIAALVIGIGLLTGGGAIAATASLAGEWHGLLDTASGPEAIGIKLNGDDANLSGGEIRPGTQAFDTVTLTGKSLHIRSIPGDFTYDGVLQEGGNMITGTLVLNGEPVPLTLVRGLGGIVLTTEQAAQVEGTWEGTIVIGAINLLVDLHIVRDASHLYVATLDSVNQGAKGLPATFSVADGKLQFKLPAVNATYQGTIDATNKEIAGSFSQNGMDMPLTLRRVAKVASLTTALTDRQAARFAGIWEGTLREFGLLVDLRITRDASGQYLCMLDSPMQGANGIPTTFTVAASDIEVTAPALGGSYKGSIDDANKSISGVFTQLGKAIPLVLAKVDKAATITRPQTPKPPYPYKTEDVTFPGGADGVVLAGTITEPEGAGPFPAIILVAGSGPNDRDESILGHKLFFVIADNLTRRGFAVLRYDKRGTHLSTGDYGSATTEDFAVDALAAVKFAKSRKEINPARIGMIGHSEGGAIAPMCAAKSPDIAFIVLLAGLGTRGDHVILWQTAAMGKADGESPEVIAAGQEMLRKVIEIYAATPDQAAAVAKLKAYADQFAAATTLPAEVRARIAVALPLVCSPWFRGFLAYDPAPALQRVHCPVLALNGSLDKQVSPDDDLPGIAAALKAGGNRDVTTAVLPGLNHLFQPATTGGGEEYAKIPTTIDPAALARIGDWLDAHGK
ncbi:MAG: alpha/beta fold hydrolase [Capsulimonadaceae bacterium]|nr:alpha/beta fold hydrolase [Capsulimonadaceae bacterium]